MYGRLDLFVIKTIAKGVASKGSLGARVYSVNTVGGGLLPMAAYPLTRLYRMYAAFNVCAGLPAKAACLAAEFYRMYTALMWEGACSRWLGVRR